MSRSIRRHLVAAVMTTGFLPATASATWSIVVLDRKTNTIGVAGASCTDYVYGIMGLLPGKGVLIAQATSNEPSIQIGMKLLGEGVSADSVWRIIGEPAFDPQLPVWPLAMRGLEGWNPDVVRTIHGYDAAVIWKGARASSSPERLLHRLRQHYRRKNLAIEKVDGSSERTIVAAGNNNDKIVLGHDEEPVVEVSRRHPDSVIAAAAWTRSVNRHQPPEQSIVTRARLAEAARHR